MRSGLLLITALFCFCCTSKEKTEAENKPKPVDVAKTTSNDTLSVADSYEHNVTSIRDLDPLPSIEQWSPDEIVLREAPFVWNPFDFALNIDTIVELLGEGAQVKTEEFEGGENEYGHYDAFSHHSITDGDTEISFYSYGNHSATITTSRLPLIHGIKIGMEKLNFLAAMNLPDTIAHANVFRFDDDYGYVRLTFRADTLDLIEANYEAGE